MARHHSLGKRFFFSGQYEGKIIRQLNRMGWTWISVYYFRWNILFFVSLEESGNWSSTRISDSGIDESLCWTSFDKWCTSTFWRKKDSHSHIFKNSKLILSVSNIILMNGWKFLFDLQNLTRFRLLM